MRIRLPDDPIVQQQWFTLLEVTDADLMEALSHGEVKVCSCHFAEDSFVHHPVHGYRYLPSTAMPTILPSRRESEAIPDKDNTLDYFFVYVDEPSSIEQMPLDQAVEANELTAIDDLNSVDSTGFAASKHIKLEEDTEKALEDNDDEEAIEEIGIEYANGKYYFLKLDDDPPASDNEARLSEVETNEHDEHDPAKPSKEENVDTVTEIDEDEEVKADGGTINETDGTDEASKDIKANDSSKSECISTYKNEVRLKKSSRTSLDEEIDFKDTNPDSTEMYELIPLAVDEFNSCDESDAEQTDGDVQKQYETLSEVEYGSIEALEDVSLCSDGNWKQKKHKKKDNFFCDDCGRGFQFKSLKERHILTHTKEKKFNCEVCGKGFGQKVNLTIHMRIHTGESTPKKFTCQICHKKCARLSELEAHRASHFRRFPHVCPLCTERYSVSTGFYEHFTTEHRGEMTLSELFELLSQNENSLVISGQEPANIKNDNGSFECTVCGKSYRLEVSLERHKRKMHMKIFSCPHCTRKFPYKSLLEKHLPLHTLEKPFKCPHCTLSYTQRVNLRIHIERKHAEIHCSNENLLDNFESTGKQVKREKAVRPPQSQPQPQTYDCEKCGKRFPRKPSLLLHLAAHGKDTKPVTFDCDACGISMCARVSLLRHQCRVHGERRSKQNVLGNLKLRNVTIVPANDNQYVEIEDETDTIVEDYESEY
ncbi:zinc finger protein 33B-like isoform X2 [Anopheles funestus]|uniref:zinc finger protein 33B-like isoform X2 n=1 Tax=Anopheles funestus TaxID=62324 RepID=UPI0020C620ED|nr:zinc finger protein 33B-like isoform X2 [Anopheles funestus]